MGKGFEPHRRIENIVIDLPGMHLYVPMLFLMISNQQAYKGCMAGWFKSFDLSFGRLASGCCDLIVSNQNWNAPFACLTKRTEIGSANINQGTLKMTAKNNPKNIAAARLLKLELSFFL